MKKYWSVLILIAVLLLAGCGTSESPSATSASPASLPIQITSKQLYQDYKDNEIAADAKYEDKWVQVTGIIDTIGKDILSQPYVVLTDGSQYAIWGIQCMFSTQDEHMLIELSKGQTVTIEGKCDGYLFNVLLRDSSLVRTWVLTTSPSQPVTTYAPSPSPAGRDTVVYEITGTAESVDVTLNSASGGTEQYSNVSVPHSYRYSNFQDDFLYISAQNNGDTGTVTVKIYVNGKLVKSASSSGAYVIATASAPK